MFNNTYIVRFKKLQNLTNLFTHSIHVRLFHCGVCCLFAVRFAFVNFLRPYFHSFPLAWSNWSLWMPINTAGPAELWRITGRLSMDYCSSSSSWEMRMIVWVMTSIGQYIRVPCVACHEPGAGETNFSELAHNPQSAPTTCTTRDRNATFSHIIYVAAKATYIRFLYGKNGDFSALAP